MFKFIQNLVPRDDDRVTEQIFAFRISCFDWNFAQFFSWKKTVSRREARKSRPIYLFTLIYQKYIQRNEYYAIASALQFFFFGPQFPLTSISFLSRSAHSHRPDDSRSAKWGNVRQDPRGVARAWRRCRRKGYRRDPRVVGEATSSAERHG